VSQLCVPQSKAAAERIAVVADADVARDGLHVFRVPASQDDVVHDERRHEHVDDLEHVLSPARLAESLFADRADIVLARVAVSIWEMRELEREHGPLAHDRAPETGAESEEEHRSAVVAAECLHRRVVDHAYRAAERAREVEPDPTLAEVPRLALRTALAHGAGEAEGDAAELPMRGCDGGQYFAHGLTRGEVRAGVYLDRRSLAGGEQLYVRAADVDD